VLVTKCSLYLHVPHPLGPHPLGHALCNLQFPLTRNDAWCVRV